MIIKFNENRINDYIHIAYQRHKEILQYRTPSCEFLDLKILTDCMSNEFKNKWLEGMFRNPPSYYPLTSMYLDDNSWMGFYYQYFGGIIQPTMQFLNNVIDNRHLIGQKIHAGME